MICSRGAPSTRHLQPGFYLPPARNVKRRLSSLGHRKPQDPSFHTKDGGWATLLTLPLIFSGVAHLSRLAKGGAFLRMFLLCSSRN